LDHKLPPPHTSTKPGRREKRGERERSDVISGLFGFSVVDEGEKENKQQRDRGSVPKVFKASRGHFVGMASRREREPFA